MGVGRRPIRWGLFWAINYSGLLNKKGSWETFTWEGIRKSLLKVSWDAKKFNKRFFQKTVFLKSYRGLFPKISGGNQSPDIGIDFGAYFGQDLCPQP